MVADDIVHIHTIDAFSASLAGLFGKQLIQLFTPDNPEGCISRQFSHHRIAETPAEIHPSDHLLDGWFQGEREPLLHGGGHASATGFDPCVVILLKQKNVVAGRGQMGCGGTACSTGSDDDNIADPLIRTVQTFRMSASLSARCFSSSAMNLSSTFCTASCSSRL